MLGWRRAGPPRGIHRSDPFDKPRSAPGNKGKTEINLKKLAMSCHRAASKRLQSRAHDTVAPVEILHHAHLGKPGQVEERAYRSALGRADLDQQSPAGREMRRRAGRDGAVGGEPVALVGERHPRLVLAHLGRKPGHLVTGDIGGIRDDQVETFDKIFFQDLIHARLKGQIRMLELRQEALLRPAK